MRGCVLADPLKVSDGTWINFTGSVGLNHCQFQHVVFLLPTNPSTVITASGQLLPVFLVSPPFKVSSANGGRQFLERVCLAVLCGEPSREDGWGAQFARLDCPPVTNTEVHGPVLEACVSFWEMGGVVHFHVCWGAVSKVRVNGQVTKSQT